MEAIIAIRLRPQSREVVDAFRDFLLALPETLTLYEVTGPTIVCYMAFAAKPSAESGACHPDEDASADIQVQKTSGDYKPP
jgi:hypothetical protein